MHFFIVERKHDPDPAHCILHFRIIGLVGLQVFQNIALHDPELGVAPLSHTNEILK
jgi:hypothetical protein